MKELVGGHAEWNKQIAVSNNCLQTRIELLKALGDVDAKELEAPSSQVVNMSRFKFNEDDFMTLCGMMQSPFYSSLTIRDSLSAIAAAPIEPHPSIKKHLVAIENRLYNDPKPALPW